MLFTVEPFSIKHDFEPIAPTGTKVADILNPIPSCDPTTPAQHTDYDMVTAPGRLPQEAAGKVLFTYVSGS